MCVYASCWVLSSFVCLFVCLVVYCGLSIVVVCIGRWCACHILVDKEVLTIDPFTLFFSFSFFLPFLCVTTLCVCTRVCVSSVVTTPTHIITCGL